MRFFLIKMRVYVNCGLCICVAKISLCGQHIHPGIIQHGSVIVPLRYNYDKPEKPRISRVFGCLARFFILFQTEKSSREVITL